MNLDTHLFQVQRLNLSGALPPLSQYLRIVCVCARACREEYNFTFNFIGP